MMEIVRLGDYVTIQTGKLDANAADIDGRYPFFTCSNENLQINEYAYDMECVIVAGNGNLNVKYFSGKFNAYQRNYIIESKNKELLITQYLYYYLSKYIDVLRNQSIGGVIKYIRLGNLTEAPIPMPDIKTQRVIVEILDHAQALIDKQKAEIEEYENLIHSIFYQMFYKTGTNYQKQKISDRFEVFSGGTPSRKNKDFWENGKIPWVKTTEVINEKICSTEENISEQGYNNSSTKLFPKDTVIIAMYGQGQTRGRVGILQIEATTNQACAGIVPNDIDNMTFIFYQLKAKYQELRDLARGGNQPNLNLSIIKEFELIFPPANVQKEFADKVNIIEKMREYSRRKLIEQQTLFSALMDKAFKGELVE